MSLAYGFQERRPQLHQNPSILAREEDYLDEDEDWVGHVKPRQRSLSVEATVNACFTSLSSLSTSLSGACTTLNSRAKKLYSRNPTQRGTQLRNSMVDTSSSQDEHSLARSNSLPDQFRSSESDLDLFGGDLEAEDPAEICLSKMAAPSSSRNSLSRLLPTRSWTQGSKNE